MNLKKYLPEIKQISHINFEYQFTIFVPVYNASQTIHRVFNSLQAQTFKNFEVIIINDGSTDASDQIITELLTGCDYEVVYINHQENKHKMGCLLEAVQRARGEFFLILDADDECTDDALSVLHQEYLAIPEDLKPKISGVTCCCVNQAGKLIGDYFPTDPFYSNSFEKKVYFDIKGEKWGFNKTQILKSIDVSNEVFAKGLIPESYLWILIARSGYTTKYINKNLRVYYIEPNGNTNLSSLGYDKKAFGMAIFAIAFINWFHRDHFHKASKHFLMRLYSLLKASRYLHFTLKDYVSSIDNYLLKTALIALWPVRKFI